MLEDDINNDLNAKYDEQYTGEITEWREISGKYKAINIKQLSKNYDFVKVLDCGAGEGSILQNLNDSEVYRELYAIEISDSGIAQIKDRKISKLIEVKKFDGYKIPYSDDYFDMVYCSHVIEHVEHPRLLIREIARVSKFQIFEVPLDYKAGIDDNIKHYLAYGHINIFTPSLFKYLIKSEGFEIIDEKFNQVANEAYRFNYYKNLNHKRTMISDVLLKLRGLRFLLKKILFGKKRYQEFGFSAYTCLVKKSGNLGIF